ASAWWGSSADEVHQTERAVSGLRSLIPAAASCRFFAHCAFDSKALEGGFSELESPRIRPASAQKRSKKILKKKSGDEVAAGIAGKAACRVQVPHFEFRDRYGRLHTAAHGNTRSLISGPATGDAAHIEHEKRIHCVKVGF